MEHEWLAGEDITADRLSSDLTSGALSITNVTTGNGTLVSGYRVVGGVCHWFISLACGSTSSISGSASVTLPFTPADTQRPVVGIGYWLDTSTAANRLVCAMHISAAGGSSATWSETGADGGSVVASSNITMAAGDWLTASGSYVIAD